MKNTLIALFLLSTLTVFGQNPDANSEAYLTYGTFFLPTSTDNIEDYVTSFQDKFTSQWPVNYTRPESLMGAEELLNYLGSRGNLTVGYNIRKGNHVIGGMLNFEHTLITHKISTATKSVNWSDSNNTGYSLAGRYHYNWINNDKLKMYSGISAGAGVRRSKTEHYFIDSELNESSEILDDYLTTKSTDFIYHLHLNAIGMRYGKDWGLILELGLGNRGLVVVGINHHLFASDKWAK